MAFKLPESLDGLSLDELAALQTEAREELSALNITEDSSDDDITTAEALVDAIATVKQTSTAATTAAEARSEKVAALRTAAEPDPEPEAAPAAEAAPEAEVEAVPVLADAEVITPDAVIVAPVEEQVAVAASTTPVQRAAANRVPIDIALPKPGISMTAAANVPGTPDGKVLESMDDIVDVLSNRVKAMPKHNMATADAPAYQRFGAVQLHRDPADPELVQGNSGNDWDLVERAAKESRLPGGSLVAAAGDMGGPGWCSPSETLYDLCGIEDVAGFLDVPEFTVKRGGIRYTKGPRWDDIYGGPNATPPSALGSVTDRSFSIDNTPTGVPGSMVDSLSLKDAAGVAIPTTPSATFPAATAKKPCIMVGCYPWYEERLDADGLCIKSPILMESTYPELIKRFTEMVIMAHRHDMNRKRINTIRAAAVANGGITALPAQTPSRTIFNLAGIEFALMGLRANYRLSTTHTIEIIAPTWLMEIIRMDLAMENGRQNRCVSDSEITAWFSCRNAKVQWVYDWQDLVVGANHLPTFPADGTPAGGAYGEPVSVELLMYPAGTWSAGVSDIISLDTVYDAASLADNVYTALFMEEAELMVQRCTETIGVSVPLCATGSGVLDLAAACVKTK